MSWPVVNAQSGSLVPSILVAFAAPITVSTEMPLYVMTELGLLWHRVGVTVRNHHATRWAEAIVDRSESGVVNDSFRQVKRVPPLKEETFIFDDHPGREVMLQFAVAATGDPNLPALPDTQSTYLAVDVSFQVRVQYRAPR